MILSQFWNLQTRLYNLFSTNLTTAQIHNYWICTFLLVSNWKLTIKIEQHKTFPQTTQSEDFFIRLQQHTGRSCWRVVCYLNRLLSAISIHMCGSQSSSVVQDYIDFCHALVTSSQSWLGVRIKLVSDQPATHRIAVLELQLSVATPLWLFRLALKLNRSQLSVVCHCGQSGEVIDWLDAAHRLVLPLRQVAIAQLYKNHHQSGNAASGKLVWKQH